MSVDLSRGVRNVLERVQVLLREKLSVERPIEQDTIQQLLVWCDQHALDIRAWCKGHQVIFDSRVLHKIERTLLELGLADLSVDSSTQDRFQQADSSAYEDKSAGSAPMDSRVLMAQANCGSYFPEWVNESPSQWVMDIDWRTLQLNQYADVLMVENRDAFYQYFALHPQRYTLPESALNALVIYRGDQHEAKGCKGLREACLAQGKRLIYFGDYDNAGLNFAVNGGYSHIMLPHDQYLFEHANDIAQGAKQINLAPSVRAFALELAEEDPLKALLLHNIEKQKGLRQQAFKGPLQVLAINR